MNLTFVETKDSDVEDLVQIYNHYIQNSTATFHTEPLSKDAFRSIVFPEYPGFGSWTIRSEGLAIGYIILSRYKPRQAFDGTAEVTIYLAPHHPGRGVGRQALEFIEIQARARRFHVLLAIICGENGASIRAFEKAGYTKCAHYHQVGFKFDRWLDLVSYEKLLDGVYR